MTQTYFDMVAASVFATITVVILVGLFWLVDQLNFATGFIAVLSGVWFFVFLHDYGENK